MLLENVISTDTVKERLRNLSTHMHIESVSDYTRQMYDELGKFLADSLEDFQELVPMGFVNAVIFALYDLEKGVDDHTQQPIRNMLVGYPSPTYNLLLMNTPRIAEATCPSEFAADVKELYKKYVTDLKVA